MHRLLECTEKGVRTISVPVAPQIPVAWAYCIGPDGLLPVEGLLQYVALHHTASRHAQKPVMYTYDVKPVGWSTSEVASDDGEDMRMNMLVISHDRRACRER